MSESPKPSPEDEKLHPVAGSWALNDLSQRKLAKKKGRRMPDPGPENYSIPRLEVQVTTSRKSLTDVEAAIQQEVLNRRQLEGAVQQSRRNEAELRAGVNQLKGEVDSLVALIKQCKRAQGVG